MRKQGPPHGCRHRTDERALLATEEISTTNIQLHKIDLATGVEKCDAIATTARYQAIRWTKAGIFALSDMTYDGMMHDGGALCRIDLESHAVVPILTADIVAETGGGSLYRCTGRQTNGPASTMPKVGTSSSLIWSRAPINGLNRYPTV
ncbi:MAG: hypothetical protein R2867_44060 [Caldilineaceae bacterium]